MAKTTFYSYFFFLAFFFSIHVFVFSFTVDLIHRDSPQSPSFNPTATKLERMTNILHRSMSRAAHLSQKTKKTPDYIQSKTSSADGTYLMKLSLGTPNFQVLGIADTGSDLSWFQCKPCLECYTQDTPLFDPKKSSSYRKMTCKSHRCDDSIEFCDAKTNHCKYELTYGDGSHSIGDVAAETLTFGSVSIPKVVFGCGYNNTGIFGETEDGIIGLGPGKYSLVNQLSPRFVKRKFSYCLVPFESNINVTSKITFGETINMTGTGVVSTPLRSKVSYYLALESILIGTKILPFKNGSGKVYSRTVGDEKFNIIIDSGTTLTMIPAPLYDDLDWELRRIINKKPTSDLINRQLKLCYSTKLNISVPIIKLKFAGGAELELPMSSTFVHVSNDLMCFAFVPTSDISILGNLSQQNLLIEYDIDNNKISFKPTDCTKQ